MRIPLFVSAAGILLVIAAGFALGLRVLSGTFQRPYVAAWSRSWAALGVYAAAAGAALLAANRPELQALRPVFGITSLVAAWVHLHSLGVGIRDLCTPDEPLPRWRVHLVGALVLVAIAMVLAPPLAVWPTPMQRYLGRLVLVALAWGIAYYHAGLTVLRHFPAIAGIGRATLAMSLIAYGSLRVLEPLMHLVGPAPVLAQVLTFGGIPLLVGLGAGMLMVLLEAEREHSVSALEARTTAERSATESEALLATALASSTDPVLVVGPDGLLLTFNERFASTVQRVRGVTPAVGMPVSLLLGSDALAFWRDAFRRAMCGESQLRLEPLVLAAGDEPRMFALRVTPVTRAGATIGVLVVAHDATEEERLRVALARREAWFRSMIENSSDIILEMSPDGTIDYASPAAERILGLRADSLPGTSALALVHPDDLPVVRDALNRAFARDATVPTAVAFRARAASGEFIQLEASSRPFTEPDGSPHLIVSARDVRERVQLEHELTAARRLESIGRLAGGVAHDFNNLLTALLGNVTMLRAHTDGSDEARELLDEVTHSARRGAELTKRLLAFAKRQQVEPQIVAPEAVIQELQPLLRRLLGEPIRLDLALAEGLWPIHVDVGAFEQVLINLVVNARDAMPTGGTLHIRAENETIGESGREGLAVPSGDWVRVEVQDTGVGMEPGVLAHVFEPFFTTKDRSGGTGLGLATSYGTVAQSGGYLRVDSQPWVGSTFSIYLPRSAPPPEAESRTEAPTHAAAPATPPLPRAREEETVLLMDDDDAVREITSKLLRRLGYTVLVAADGDEGVALAATTAQRIDLVISDIVMPRMNGLEAVSRIRGLRPEVPIIFISGYTDQASLWEADETPPGPLLPKPFSLEELAAETRSALDAV